MCVRVFATIWAELKHPFGSSEEVTAAWHHDKTIRAAHAEVDMSDHSANHRHSDLAYGNHLSTERTSPAHHRGIFHRLSKAKSNIS